MRMNNLALAIILLLGVVNAKQSSGTFCLQRMAFGYHWKPFLEAAETELKIWQQKGSNAYMNYRGVLLATDHTEGQLTQSDINNAASAAGASNLKAKNERERLGNLARTDARSQTWDFQSVWHDRHASIRRIYG